MLICPNCQSPLTKENQQYRCHLNHCFDIGKAGDVNLLLPNQKRSLSPGDSKAMVAARQQFLASGVYQPIAELLAKYITLLSAAEPMVIADAGCGEGYYLRRIQQLCYPNQALFSQYGGQFIGWDISKYAVQRAAKQSEIAQAMWLTASNAAIPLADNSIDILCSAFGFEVEQAFARVLQHQGYCITVNAGEQHLIELRRVIYDDIKPYQPKNVLSHCNFHLIKQETLNYEIELDEAQIEQLMLMTPHFYRAKIMNKEKLKSFKRLATTVDAVFQIYQRVSKKS